MLGVNNSLESSENSPSFWQISERVRKITLPWLSCQQAQSLFSVQIDFFSDEIHEDWVVG